MQESIPPYKPELIAQFESDIGVPEGFFSRIIHEDDWSFIVKLHGMFEAGLTQLLLAHLGEVRLETPLAKLNVMGASGKLAFVRALELLPQHNLNYIQKLTEIRNSIVHKVSNVIFSIEDHIRGLNQQDLQGLINACGDGIIPKQLDFCRPFEDQRKETFLQNPRELFWWSGLLVLGNLAKSKQFHTAKREIADVEKDVGRIVLKRDKNDAQ